ncbi:MAG: DUF6499 domain-containing protein [Allopontixanthobacter sediminis]
MCPKRGQLARGKYLYFQGSMNRACRCVRIDITRLTCLLYGRDCPCLWNVRCNPAGLANGAERRCFMAHATARDAQTSNFDFSDFAQEFLRRNPAYKNQYASLCSRSTKDKKSSAGWRMARSWGLEFPVRSECFGRRLPCNLEKRCQCKRRYRGWRLAGPRRYQRQIHRQPRNCPARKRCRTAPGSF